jgi:hypothetical protein
MAEQTKEKLITVRVAEDKHAEFKIAADLRGATMSSLIHQYIFQIIREEKRQHPEAFTHLGTEAGKEPHPPTPKVVQSKPRKRDKIDEVIDAALAYGGGPISDTDRKKIREILENQSGEESP